MTDESMDFTVVIDTLTAHGRWIGEQYLAHEVLGLPRSRVRRALEQAESEGLVESRPDPDYPNAIIHWRPV